MYFRANCKYQQNREVYLEDAKNRQVLYFGRSYHTNNTAVFDSCVTLFKKNSRFGGLL